MTNNCCCFLYCLFWSKVDYQSSCRWLDWERQVVIGWSSTGFVPALNKKKDEDQPKPSGDQMAECSGDEETRSAEMLPASCASVQTFRHVGTHHDGIECYEVLGPDGKWRKMKVLALEDEEGGWEAAVPLPKTIITRETESVSDTSAFTTGTSNDGILPTASKVGRRPSPPIVNRNSMLGLSAVSVPNKEQHASTTDTRFVVTSPEVTGEPAVAAPKERRASTMDTRIVVTASPEVAVEESEEQSASTTDTRVVVTSPEVTGEPAVSKVGRPSPPIVDRNSMLGLSAVAVPMQSAGANNEITNSGVVPEEEVGACGMPTGVAPSSKSESGSSEVPGEDMTMDGAGEKGEREALTTIESTNIRGRKRRKVGAKVMVSKEIAL